MTLLEIRTQLIKQTGRFDLVIDATNYADAGADYYINQAQHWLDRNLDTQYNRTHFRKDVVANVDVITLPNFRSVERAYLYGDGKKIELRKRSRDYLLRLYDQDSTVSSLDRITPLYYAEVPIKTIDDGYSYGSDVITNGKFTTDLAGWTVLGSGVAQGSGHCNHTAIGTGAIVVTTPPLVSATDYLVQIRVYRTGSTGYINVNNGALGSYFDFAGSGVVKRIITANATGFQINFTEDFAGWIDDVVVKSITISPTFTDESFLTLNNVPGNFDPSIGLIIRGVPEDDSTWTLVVEGQTYSDTLDEDYDTSFWTEQHPQTLIDATRMFLERTRRNTAGRREMLEIVQDDLSGIRDDDIHGEVAQFKHTENWDE